MTKKILISQGETLRVARMDGKDLEDLEVESPEREQKVDVIYTGEVVSTPKSLQAAFVKYSPGSERNGFLPLKEVAPEFYPNQNKDNKLGIGNVLFEGQKVLVQVTKEERGSKGAALSTYITLAGSYLVLMPNNPKAGGISRRIEGEDRDELKHIFNNLKIPEDMGVIIRTAALGKDLEEVQWDLDVLVKLWNSIKEARDTHGAPCLVHQDNDAVTRTLRDHLRPDIKEIVVDDKAIYEQVIDFIKRVRPDFVDRVKFYDDPVPLFSRYQIEKQIEAAFQRKIRLPSGGEIVIDRTEALTAVDVNSAQATKGDNIEETARNTNIEAGIELARQLRLRDLGGLIVVDFIDMDEAKNRRDVERALQDALRTDRARTQIEHISKFGLLEMSRQCLRSSLEAGTQVSCPRCHGRGSIQNIKSQANMLIHLIEDAAMKTKAKGIHAQIPVDVATYILNEKHEFIEDIQKRHGIAVTIVPNPYMQTPQYDISPAKKSGKQSADLASYELLSMPNVYYQRQDLAEEATHKIEPIVKNVLPDHPAPTPKVKKEGPGLLKRIFGLLFGPSKPKAKRSSHHRGNRRDDRHDDRRRSSRSSHGDSRRRHTNNRRPSQSSNRQRHRDHDNRDRRRSDDPRRSTKPRSSNARRDHAERRQPTPAPEKPIKKPIETPEKKVQPVVEKPVVAPTPVPPPPVAKPVEPPKPPKKEFPTFPKFDDKPHHEDAEKWVMVETKKSKDKK